MKLRPYQENLIAETRKHLLAGRRSVLIQSPTGSGKTATTAEMLGGARNRGKRAWFVVHRRELVKQSIAAFQLAGIPCGVIATGYRPDAMQQIQVASVGTLARRLDLVMPPDLIVWDESHHVAARSWSGIMARYPRARHIGLTATPERLDGQGLGQWFEVMVEGPPVRWLIDHGFLADYRVFVPPRVADLSRVATRMGDFDKKQVEELMDSPSITGDAVSHYRKLADGKRAVAFACSVAASRHLVDQFRQEGIPAEHVDGATKTEIRDAAIARFAAGETLVLSNVELFGEGFDLPAIEAAILLRPTKSLGLYLQQVGRALRPSPGKTAAIILDHVGNVARHGLPDEPREWDLHQVKRSKRKAAATITVRMCPLCYASCPSRSPRCTDCGHTFDVAVREIEQVAGELTELTAEEGKRLSSRMRIREQARAESIEDLTAIGAKRGYKNPRGWAERITEARERKRAG